MIKIIIIVIIIDFIKIIINSTIIDFIKIIIKSIINYFMIINIIIIIKVKVTKVIIAKANNLKIINIFKVIN